MFFRFGSGLKSAFSNQSQLLTGSSRPSAMSVQVVETEALPPSGGPRLGTKP